MNEIVGLAGKEELAKLVQRLNKASIAYGMEISAKKTKLMTNNTSGINTEIIVNGQKLETVTSFKYLGSVITDEGSKHRQQQHWQGWNPFGMIGASSKIRLIRSLVTSIFLYACES